MTEIEPKKNARRPKLNLPFDSHKNDPGEWAYDHRIGICVTVIAYLILSICFVAGKIVIGDKASDKAIYIDLQTLAQLESEKERLEREVEQKQQKDNIDWDKIQNLVSNENAEQSDDATKSQAATNDPAAEQLQREMRDNREAYEKGLAEEQAILNSKNSKTNNNTNAESKDSKIKGSVTVSFSLTKPIRTSRRLIIPAYRCEGGGQVDVEIVVNREGKVISADIISGGDKCMQETALNAARSSLFNIDNSAPAKQSGTITYIFIPQ